MNRVGKIKQAYTIVELIVVIVILGILASIVFMSYSGINRKAIEAVIQSDASNATKKLAMFKVENEYYPQTVNCSIPDSSTNLCIKTSGGSNLLYINDETTAPQTFSLYIYGSGVYYSTNQDSDIQKQSGLPKIWKQVAAGESHTCAIAIGGVAYCWGNNGAGQLGDGTNNSSQTPVPVYTGGVLSGKTIKAISAGASFTCAIASDSKAYCWGSGNNGRLGRGSTVASNVPVAVTSSGVLNGKTLTTLVLGWQHACVLATDQKVYCWGYGSNGQLGNNTTADSSNPVAVSLGLNVSKIEAGSNHTCIINTSSKVYCWGQNSDGQLGDNTTTYKATPVSIYTSGASSIYASYTIRDITAGWAHTCVVVNETEKVSCWGDDTYYQVGASTVMARFTIPTEVDPSFGFNSSKRVSKFLSGSNHTCILDTLGDLYCWGDGTYYQNGSTATVTKPALRTFSGTPLQGKTIKNMGQNMANHSCVIANDDQIYCWGYNYYSQLGNNLTSNSAAFVMANQVP